MAIHAAGNRSGQVRAIGDPVLLWRRINATDRRPPRSRERLVVMRLDANRIVYRRHAAQIGDDRFDVFVRQVAIGARRHRWTDQSAVWPPSFAYRGKYLVVGPLAYAGLRIGRYVGGSCGEVRMLDDVAAREFFVRQRTVRSLWGMTVPASGYRFDEIPAALELALGTTWLGKHNEQ